MGEVTRLGIVIENISKFNSEETIYAIEPWTEISEAIVAKEADDGSLPSKESTRGMTYFLEVGIVQHFIEDWLSSSRERPTSSFICKRVIDYAIHDA